MKTLLLFCILTINTSAFSQKKINTFIELSNNLNANNKSSSRGDKLIEYNNYSLFDLISKITNVPIQYFKIEDKSINQKNVLVNFKMVSDSVIDENELINSFLIEVRNKLKLKIKRLKEKQKVKVIYCGNESKMNKCSENSYESKVIRINRTFKGECITTNTFVNQIEDWFGIHIINDLNPNNRYNFEIHHANSLEELIEELFYFYTIDIMEDIRLIETINITKI